MQAEDPFNHAIKQCAEVLIDEFSDDFSDAITDIYKDILNIVERIDGSELDRVNIVNEVFIQFHSYHIAQTLAIYPREIQEGILVRMHSNLKKLSLKARDHFLIMCAKDEYDER
jgi:hypothetical protein